MAIVHKSVVGNVVARTAVGQNSPAVTVVNVAVLSDKTVVGVASNKAGAAQTHFIGNVYDVLGTFTHGCG